MCANSHVFERVHLPTDLYETHFLDWLMPLSKNESLDSYITRFSKLITTPKPIFIGVSFGGIIAQELAAQFNNSQVVIISSIKHQNELGYFHQFLKQTKIYKLLPIRFINYGEKQLFKIANPSFKRTLKSYRKYLTIRDVIYTQWAIQIFFNWKQSKTLNILHIHGDKDLIFPLKHIKKAIIISEGTHGIILSKSSTIQSEIIKFLA